MRVWDRPALALAPSAHRRVHNFSGGPGALPAEVLAEAQEAILRAPGSDLSVLGISHRSAWFGDVLAEARDNLRALLDLPSEYEILFLQGGASLQFSMVPMALLRGRSQAAEYVVGGYWSAKAVPEAQREGLVRIIWNGQDGGFSRLPRAGELSHDPEAAYLHYVANETVEGLQFHRVLGLDGVARVCDMSSDFLSRPVDCRKFALIYAHAQKNLGPAGVTVVVLRRDLLDGVPDGLPAMLDYRNHVHMGSVYNTPPVFAIYVTLLLTRWLRRQPDGLAGMARLNEAKAALLYAVLDASGGFYASSVAVPDRSIMNVTFRLPDEPLERRFLAEAEAEGFYGLQGHRSRGGIRASLYNAVTLESVRALAGFMEDFRARHA
ncbi:MAG TPA: 3-phosphoserine/phosphohydroxythreonine transaminase [Chloroflexota bacterium]|nr:3-phosphoserine/phosphohydroxythreonine transaminase [Chloroflexota bacterium]